MNSKILGESLILLAKEMNDPKKAVSLFLTFLEKNHLSKLLPNTLNFLEIRQKKIIQLETAHLKTSHEFSQKTIENVLKILNTRDIKVKTLVDESLIGGFELKHKGYIYDGSLKNYLFKLRTELIKLS